MSVRSICILITGQAIQLLLEGGCCQW